MYMRSNDDKTYANTDKAKEGVKDEVSSKKKHKESK